MEYCLFSNKPVKAQAAHGNLPIGGSTCHADSYVSARTQHCLTFTEDIVILCRQAAKQFVCALSFNTTLHAGFIAIPFHTQAGSSETSCLRSHHCY